MQFNEIMLDIINKTPTSVYLYDKDIILVTKSSIFYSPWEDLIYIETTEDIKNCKTLPIKEATKFLSQKNVTFLGLL